MKAERGAENVFDFTLGNPLDDPPAEVIECLRRVAAENPRSSHGYMPNAGYPAVRAAIASKLATRTRLPYTAGHIMMTVGSAGGINAVLKSILDPGDEVIVLVPYFPEYQFYISNHGGRMVLVETGSDFRPRADRLSAAITPRTKAIIINSPNNPTGVVYSAAALAEIERVVADAGTDLVVISDEPYRSLVFDGIQVPETASAITRCITATSWSKSCAIAGERIGYIAISPRIAEAETIADACTFANRVLGFVNAPAIWQRVMAEAGDASIDPTPYQIRRDLLCDGLCTIGYELQRPEGAFYLFPKTPIPDDVAFIRMLQQEGVLVVPGSGFGRAGHFRLSMTVPLEIVERSLPAFERAFRNARVS